MNPFEILDACLLDLLFELEETEIRLMLGGGYGLYLKHERIRDSGERTLLFVPSQSRATNDLEIFLNPEMIARPEQVGALAAALERLRYVPVPTARFTQFLRTLDIGGVRREVKLDLLTGPRECFVEYPHVEVDARRAKPRPSVNLHAHPTDEAIALAIDPLEIIIRGRRSGGEVHEGVVLLPQTFTYVLMKLFAFRDRVHDRRKVMGSHHAYDLYILLALTTESEWDQAFRMSERHRAHEIHREACAIVEEYFADRTALGVLRLREHPNSTEEIEVAEFIRALSDLFRVR